MRALLLPLATLATLAASAVAVADTVYYRSRDAVGIEQVSGTIIQEAGRLVEIETGDGLTVLIPKSDVFQIVRDRPLTTDSSPDSVAGEPVPETPSRLISDDRSREMPRPASKRRFGLTGGMNVSNLRADPEELEDHDSLRSFAVGLWWGIPLHRRLTLRPETLYSVKGDAERAEGYTASTRMAYIDVPVLARIGFRHGDPVKPSLFAGPSFAFNVSAKSKLEGEDSETEVDIKDQVRTVDVGLVLGGGLDFPLAGRTYGLELRYSRGLTDAATDAANGSAHHDVLALMGSVRLQ